MAKKKNKADIKAPCGYQFYNEEMGREVFSYPVVSCKLECETCGFNPAVQEARLAAGLTRRGNVRTILIRREKNAEQNSADGAAD